MPNLRVLMTHLVLRAGLTKTTNYTAYIVNLILKKDMFLLGIISLPYQF